MTNAQRTSIITAFSRLYASRDVHVMLAHMPKEANDPEGRNFEAYFDFLQGWYKLLGSFNRMDREEIDASKTLLMAEAAKYGYPTSQIEAL